jgi:hypothetical protein
MKAKVSSVDVGFGERPTRSVFFWSTQSIQLPYCVHTDKMILLPFVIIWVLNNDVCFFASFVIVLQETIMNAVQQSLDRVSVTFYEIGQTFDAIPIEAGTQEVNFELTLSRRDTTKMYRQQVIDFLPSEILIQITKLQCRRARKGNVLEIAQFLPPFNGAVAHPAGIITMQGKAQFNRRVRMGSHHKSSVRVYFVCDLLFRFNGLGNDEVCSEWGGFSHWAHYKCPTAFPHPGATMTIDPMIDDVWMIRPGKYRHYNWDSMRKVSLRNLLKSFHLELEEGCAELTPNDGYVFRVHPMKSDRDDFEGYSFKSNEDFGDLIKNVKCNQYTPKLVNYTPVIDWHQVKDKFRGDGYAVETQPLNPEEAHLLTDDLLRLKLSPPFQLARDAKWLRAYGGKFRHPFIPSQFGLHARLTAGDANLMTKEQINDAKTQNDLIQMIDKKRKLESFPCAECGRKWGVMPFNCEHEKRKK